MSHSQFHCTGRVYLDLHGLIFETSICYWQDQPGSPCVVRAQPGPPQPPFRNTPAAGVREGRSVSPDRWSARGRGAAAGHVPGPPRGSPPPRPSVSVCSTNSPRRPGSAAGPGGVSFGSLRVLECPRARGDSLSDFEKKCLPENFTPHRALPQAENGALQAAWAPSKDAWDRRVRSGSLQKGTAGERPPSPGPQRRTRGVQEPSTRTLKRTRQGPCNGESRKPLDQSPKSATGEP